MGWRLSHAKQDFGTSINNIRITSIGNSIILLLYMMYSTSYNLQRMVILLFSVLVLELLRRFYKWGRALLNKVILMLYTTSVVLEYWLCGHLDMGLEVDLYSKGMLLEMFLALIPYLYYSIRIGLAYPLLLVELLRINVIQADMGVPKT